MITEDRITETRDSRKRYKLTQQLKRQNGKPNYLKITRKEQISGMN